MRTTVNLNDDILEKAKHRAVDLGISLSELINRLLDEKLREKPVKRPVFRMITYGDARRREHLEPADMARILEEEELAPYRKGR